MRITTAKAYELAKLRMTGAGLGDHKDMGALITHLQIQRRDGLKAAAYDAPVVSRSGVSDPTGDLASYADRASDSLELLNAAVTVLLQAASTIALVASANPMARETGRCGMDGCAGATETKEGFLCKTHNARLRRWNGGEHDLDLAG